MSWRFKPLDDAFPFVVITAPADHRLLRDPAQAVGSACEVRALVIGRRAIRGVCCHTGDGDWMPMVQRSGGRVWSARLAVPADRLVTITVQATDDSGRPGQHSIRAASPSYVPPSRARNGSDAASVGAWPENGILGTQLGPNRNGRPRS